MGFTGTVLLLGLFQRILQAVPCTALLLNPHFKNAVLTSSCTISMSFAAARDSTGRRDSSFTTGVSRRISNNDFWFTNTFDSILEVGN